MNASTGRRARPHREDRARPYRENLAPAPPARLTLRPPTFPPGPVSGAWWPRSDDLAAELPALVEAFDTAWGRVTRMAAHRSVWRDAPCDLPVTGHTVRAAWYTSGFDPHAVRLFAYGVGRRDLLVVPPGTEQNTARRLMGAAADPARNLTASALLDL